MSTCSSLTSSLLHNSELGIYNNNNSNKNKNNNSNSNNSNNGKNNNSNNNNCNNSNDNSNNSNKVKLVPRNGLLELLRSLKIDRPRSKFEIPKIWNEKEKNRKRTFFWCHDYFSKTNTLKANLWPKTQ